MFQTIIWWVLVLSGITSHTPLLAIEKEENHIYILLGYPGTGKGTLSEQLKSEGFYHISTGDLLRAQTIKQPLQEQYKQAIDNGAILLPDSLINKIVENKILEAWNLKKKNIILDGFPKTITQDEFLHDVLKKYSLPYKTLYIFLHLSPDESIKRVSNRVYCSKCGAIFNIISKPPLKQNECDNCGDNLTRRSSDIPSSIKKKIELFNQTTSTLIEKYKFKKELISINADINILSLKEKFLDTIKKIKYIENEKN